MPQRWRNETQRHKTRRKTPQRGDDHASRAVTIHQQTCAWRSNCHHDVEDGNCKGYGAATGLQLAGKGLGKDTERVDDHRSRAESHADGTNQYDPPASKESVAAIAGADPLRHTAKYIRAPRPLSPVPANVGLGRVGDGPTNSRSAISNKKRRRDMPTSQSNPVLESWTHADLRLLILTTEHRAAV